MRNMDNVYYNDVKRTTIAATIDFALQHGTSYEEALRITASMLYPYKITSLNTLQNYFALAAVCFFDYYTVLSYKRRQHALTIEEHIDFTLLSQLHNLLELYTLWEREQKCYLRAIDACYQLHQKSDIEKAICIEQMTAHEHAYLNSIYPTHEQDLNCKTSKKQKEEVYGNCK